MRYIDTFFFPKKVFLGKVRKGTDNNRICKNKWVLFLEKENPNFQR